MFNKRLNNVYLISLWHLLFFFCIYKDSFHFVRWLQVWLSESAFQFSARYYRHMHQAMYWFFNSFYVWISSVRDFMKPCGKLKAKHFFTVTSNICQFLLERRRLLKTFACCSETFTVLGSFSKCQQRIADTFYIWWLLNFCKSGRKNLI